MDPKMTIKKLDNPRKTRSCDDRTSKFHWQNNHHKKVQDYFAEEYYFFLGAAFFLAAFFASGFFAAAFFAAAMCFPPPTGKGYIFSQSVN